MKTTIVNPFIDGEGRNCGNENSSPGGRAFAMEAIKANWVSIVAHTGKLYLTSKEVLEAMHSLKVSYSPSGQQLKKANAIGDVLGKHGLHLPTMMIDGKKHHFLGAIDMTEVELKAFNDASDDEKGRRVAEVIQSVKGRLRAMELFASDEEEPHRDEKEETRDDEEE